MKKNDIVTLITAAGEFVGKFIEETDNGFSIGAVSYTHLTLPTKRIV